MKISKKIKIGDILLVSRSHSERLYEILEIKKDGFLINRFAFKEYNEHNDNIRFRPFLSKNNRWKKIKIIPLKDLILYSHFATKTNRYYELIQKGAQ